MADRRRVSFQSAISTRKKRGVGKVRCCHKPCSSPFPGRAPAPSLLNAPSPYSLPDAVQAMSMLQNQIMQGAMITAACQSYALAAGLAPPSQIPTTISLSPPGYSYYFYPNTLLYPTFETWLATRRMAPYLQQGPCCPTCHDLDEAQDDDRDREDIKEEMRVPRPLTGVTITEKGRDDIRKIVEETKRAMEGRRPEKMIVKVLVKDEGVQAVTEPPKASVVKTVSKTKSTQTEKPEPSAEFDVAGAAELPSVVAEVVKAAGEIAGAIAEGLREQAVENNLPHVAAQVDAEIEKEPDVEPIHEEEHIEEQAPPPPMPVVTAQHDLKESGSSSDSSGGMGGAVSFKGHLSVILISCVVFLFFCFIVALAFVFSRLKGKGQKKVRKTTPFREEDDDVDIDNSTLLEMVVESVIHNTDVLDV